MAGRSKKGAERLLTLRGLTYWFRKAVPEDCTADYGASFFLVNLHSGDLRHVQGLRDRLEAGAKQIVQDIRAGRWANGRKLSLGGIDASGGGLLPEQRGELWQATLQQMESDPDTDPDQLELARYAEEQERERLRKAARKQFEKGRKGAFPIDRYLADYQKTIAALAPATVKGRGGHVATFARWCSEEGITLDKVTRRVAGRYMTDKLDAMHPRTRGEHLASLRLYWDYMTGRGLVDKPDALGSIWASQNVRAKAMRVNRNGPKPERAFTEEEVQLLVYAPWPKGLKEGHRQSLMDVIKIGLLSGMRQEEIVTLRVGDIVGDVFDLKEGKTTSAVRKVPIHPDLLDIVTRRTEGRHKDAWLFDEFATMEDPGDTFGKRFRRYRVALGVDEKAQGVRRSLVNFHSTRRWFITSAERANISERVVEDVVGHKRDEKRSITFSIYSDGSDAAQRRTCVESVRLPPAPSPVRNAA